MYTAVRNENYFRINSDISSTCLCLLSFGWNKIRFIFCWLQKVLSLMTSSNGNILYASCSSWWESTYRSPVGSPNKDQWRGALMFYLICTWTNEIDAGDLRRHRSHNDVIVMNKIILTCYHHIWWPCPMPFAPHWSHPLNFETVIKWPPFNRRHFQINF